MFGSTNTTYYKYSISKIDIMIPGFDNIIVEYNGIAGMIVEKDYDNDVHPVLQIKLALRPIDIFNILDHKDTVRFNVRLDKYSYRAEDDTNYIFKELSFNEVFGIYIDDNTVQLDKELYMKAKNVKKTETDISDVSEVYSFFLFKEKDIDSVRSMHNAIIQRGSMTDVVTYLLSTAGCRNILMSPIDNQNVYNEIMIYPMTLLSNIKRLNNIYGFYRNGLTMFFDIPRTYFIDKRGQATAYARGEYTDVFVYVYKSANTFNMKSGFEKDIVNKRYNINILVSSIHMKTGAYIMNETIGSDILVIDSLSDTVGEYVSNTPHRGESKTKVIDKLDVGGTNNEFIESEALARIQETESIFEVGLAGIDIDILTPNKRFTFVFEDSLYQKKLGGIYRIHGVNAIFTPKGQSMNISAVCTFLKIK